MLKLDIVVVGKRRKFYKAGQPDYPDFCLDAISLLASCMLFLFHSLLPTNQSVFSIFSPQKTTKGLTTHIFTDAKNRVIVLAHDSLSQSFLGCN
jgi:hypothetical protein